MSDPLAGGITSDVPVRGDFKDASLGATPAPIPVMSVRIKPEAVANIINNLDDLKGRTNDSEIVKQGSQYSFMDKRTDQPLAKLDAAGGTLKLYKTPEALAQRIDSVFVSTKDIKDFIKENAMESAPQVKLANSGPS